MRQHYTYIPPTITGTLGLAIFWSIFSGLDQSEAYIPTLYNFPLTTAIFVALRFMKGLCFPISGLVNNSMVFFVGWFLGNVKIKKIVRATDKVTNNANSIITFVA